MPSVLPTNARREIEIMWPPRDRLWGARAMSARRDAAPGTKCFGGRYTPPRTGEDNMIGRVTLLVAMAAVLLACPSAAADLKVISAGAVRGLIGQIIDDYSSKTGQKF